MRGRRASVPKVWLLSDPVRLPDPTGLLGALPRGAGVLLRGATPEVAWRVAAMCRRRGLVLMVGGEGRLALRLGAGLHLPDRSAGRNSLPFLLNRRGRLLSAAVHGRAGLVRARRMRADFALVSPAFPTQSHPGAPALGPFRWASLARATGRPAVALGGMTAQQMRRLRPLGASGWAAIGVWQAWQGVCGVSATLSQGSRAWVMKPVAGP